MGFHVSKFDAFYESCRIPNPENDTSFPNVFILGCLEQRVSFLAQQTRAINLILALQHRKTLSPDKRLCIVGGGVAGTTAAVYASHEGIKSTVFEKTAMPFSLQAGSRRWLHPNINDWPRPGWEQKRTNLPVMNWEADEATKVIATLRSEWQKALNTSSIAFHHSASPTLEKTANAWLLKWNGKQEEADIVILAVGFGEERTANGISGTYWHDSNDHQALTNGGSVLISGSGDGGLTDTLRIALRDFSHSWLGELAETKSLGNLAEAVSKIENNLEDYATPVQLTQSYLNLPFPQDLLDKLQARRKTNLRTFLNAQGKAPFRRSSAPIHRVLIAALIKLKIVEYIPGELDNESITSREEGGFDVTVTEGNKSTKKHYDRILLRHGTNSALKASFPQIAEIVKSTRSHNQLRPALSHLTRAPLWLESKDPGVAPPQTAAPSTAQKQRVAKTTRSLQEHVRKNLTKIGKTTCAEDIHTGVIKFDIEYGAPNDIRRATLAFHISPTKTGTCIQMRILAPKKFKRTQTLASDWQSLDAHSIEKSIQQAFNDLDGANR